MTWRDKMLAASFRGVPFEVERDSQPAGQRTQVHEYPLRDKPQIEPLGRRSIPFTITAFVAGADCLEQRDRLLEAIETPGSGELIHPWLGSRTVTVTDCTYSHERRAMGVVRFELVFVEGEDQPAYPVSSNDTAQLLNGAAQSVQTSALQRLVAALASINLQQLRPDALLAPLGQVLSIVREVYGDSVELLGAAQWLIDAVLAGPEGLGRSLFSMFSDSQTSFEGFSRPGNGLVSLTGIGDRADSLPRLGSTLVPAGDANSGFVRAVRGLVQDAIVSDMVRGIAKIPIRSAATHVDIVRTTVGAGASGTSVSMDDVGAVVQNMLGPPSVQPPVAQDVLQLRDRVSESMWQMAESSPADHYQAIASARSLAVRRLTQVAGQGIQLTRVNVSSPAPALVMAYRRYGSADRTADIVARNRIQHPGFLPATSLMMPRA